MFVGNKAFTNLPRKFNVGISGCTEHCTHAESQDLALTPAVKTSSGQTRHGFNVAVGGKMGSGGCKIASPLDIFVEPAEAAAVCREIVLLFRDHGSRAARNRARLSFLLEKWGADRFRRELEQRLARTLERAGRDARIQRGADHIGIHKQKQAGLNYAGLLVAVGRVPASTLREVARVATEYGTGDIRFTTTPEHHHPERAGRDAAAVQKRAAARGPARTIRPARCAGWSRAPASTIATSR